MPNDAEMLARLRATVAEDCNLTPEQEEDIRWAVERIERLEGALGEIRAECLENLDCNRPDEDEDENGDWNEDGCSGDDCVGCALTHIVDAALAPVPAKEGEVKGG